MNAQPRQNPHHGLSFKNCFQLFLEGHLDELLGHPGGPGPVRNRATLAGLLRKWRLHRVRDVFLMEPPGAAGSPPLLDLERILRKNGLRLHRMPLNALTRGDFAAQIEFNRVVTRTLKQNPAVVLFQERARLEVQVSLATLLLTPPGGISPEQALRYVAGKNPGDAAAERLRQFKKLLDPDYNPPVQVEIPEPGSGATTRTPAPESRPAVAKGGPNAGQPLVSKLLEAGDPPKTEGAPTKTDAAAPPATPAAPAPEPASPVALVPAIAAAPKTPAPAPVAKAAKVAEDPGEPTIPADPDFKSSKFTIKVKMVGIISTIILGALGAMVVLATYFFRDDSEIRIQENNLALTEVIGGRVQSEFENIAYKGLLLATNVLESPPAEQKIFTDLFFRKNADIIFVGVARANGQDFEFTREEYNTSFLADRQIEIDEVRRLHGLGREAFFQSFSGGTVVRNVSSGFPLPVLGLSLPFNEKTIVIVYLWLNEDPEQGRFLKSFSRETTKIATAFLVDNQGSIIAHPDLNLVRAGTDLVKVPIVEAALQSKNPNGLTNYSYEGVDYLGSFRKLEFANLAVISTVDAKQALAAVEDIQRRNVIITLIVVLVSVLIVYFFARSISVPILRLVEATRQVESGDYAVSITPAARDEVGRLTNSFVQMASGLAERERVKSALGKFVNKEIAERAARGEIKLGGENKLAAVFFSDLRGFTAMSEGRTPEEVVSILNEYFTEMVHTIEETNGIVDKFIGDAIMAHWGAVKSVGNDTENAINAALAMRRALIRLNNKNEHLPDRPWLKMGSGINTGPVISGQIGSDNRFEFTVIGDAVNLASRIEALNKPFGSDILISQDSYEMVKDIFVVEAMPAIKVKGKSEPQAIFAVIARKDDPDAPQSLDEVRALLHIEFDPDKAGGGEEKEVKYEILAKK